MNDKPANLELFPPRKRSSSAPAQRELEGRAPLADRVRPHVWEEFSGLELLEPRLLEQLRTGSGRPPSLVLWGPPGSGKTTLARLIGGSFESHFVEFSAVLGGVKEVREIVDQALRSALPTILFVDEIHRFNRAQQDAFLPHVEKGTISLIGATTENPSFYLTSALLSRSRVVVLPALDETALTAIVHRGAAALGVAFDTESCSAIVALAGGDARKTLNLVESIAVSFKPTGGQVTGEELKSFFRNEKSAFYDRSGEEHYNMVSAFIKSMRGSDPDAALYWGFRMIESGEDPRFIARRMMIFASEDIGNADPRALALAVATSEAYDRLGMPEGKIPLAQCITYLATAPKSNRSYLAMGGALQSISESPKVTVPLHLRNAPTSLMQQLGYGSEYQYPHDSEGSYVPGIKYLPEEAQGKVFYEPSEQGYEKNIRELMTKRQREK